MGKKYQKDDAVWRNAFGDTLKMILVLYDLDYSEFCKKYGVSAATFRYWRSGSKLPQRQYIENLKEFLCDDKLNDVDKLYELREYVGEFMREQGAEKKFLAMQRKYPDGRTFSGEILSFYRQVAKHEVSLKDSSDMFAQPTGKTQAIVFDFDGTLTRDRLNRTTWESIWMDLGYTERDCQQLHERFNKNEITHAEWCKITEEKFKERHLHKETVEKIASKIHLIKGVRETLRKLSGEGIKIYIVSGSIDIIIKKVLRDMTQYVEEIKANYFKFNSAGFLTEIVGTKYDFEGKSLFISQIAVDLHISPEDILFVGNSINDRFAYRSGAKTLCINPILVDPTDIKVWNKCILSCDDLREIIPEIL